MDTHSSPANRIEQLKALNDPDITPLDFQSGQITAFLF